MHPSIVPLVLTVIVVSADGTSDAKKDLEKMQGEWALAALEVNGQPVPEPKLKDTMLLVKGDKYITKVKDKSYETTFTLDAAKKPKAIDMVFAEGEKKDQILKGIYRLDGDKLQVCRGLDPKQDRPTEFATWPGTNLFLVTWKRK